MKLMDVYESEQMVHFDIGGRIIPVETRMVVGCVGESEYDAARFVIAIPFGGRTLSVGITISEPGDAQSTVCSVEIEEHDFLMCDAMISQFQEFEPIPLPVRLRAIREIDQVAAELRERSSRDGANWLQRMVHWIKQRRREQTDG